MNAALRPNFAPTVWPDWRRLVSINAASERLEVDADHLSKMCRTRLEPAGMAYYGAHPNGGQPKWFICSDYDLRLAAGPIGDDWIEPDLSAYSNRQRESGLQRRACVEAFDTLKYEGRTSRDQVQRLIDLMKEKFPGLSISRTRLYAWAALYRRPADTLKLIDHRGGHRNVKPDDAAWKMFADLYLHPNQPSIRFCWKKVKEAAIDNGWRWCEEDACRYQLNDRIPVQDQIRQREPARYRSSLQPFIQQHPESWAANECYVGDHKNLDVICRWRDTLIRPWLSTWMDWRTRRIVGYVLVDQPNSTSILAALRCAMLDPANFGGPNEVWIDNGKDYDAWMFHGATKKERLSKIRPAVDEARTDGIFNKLSIKAHFSIAFNPNGKARLETWFRNITPFCRTFDTYTGLSIDTKPESLNEILKNPRLIPTFDVVKKRLADFIDGYNRRTEHDIDDLAEDGRTISPDEAMARWCTTRKLRDPADLHDLLMNWHKPVTVGKNGISMSLGGQTIHYGQYEPALAPFKADLLADRRPVMVSFDPQDIRTVRVHDDQWRFVCEASMNQLGGWHGTDAVSVNHVKQANRNKSHYEKASRVVAEHSLTSVLTPEEQSIQVAVESNKPQPTHAMKIAPATASADAVSQSLKTAIGAESASPPVRRALPSLARLQNNQRASDDAMLRPNPFAKLREQLHEW